MGGKSPEVSGSYTMRHADFGTGKSATDRKLPQEKQLQKGFHDTFKMYQAVPQITPNRQQVIGARSRSVVADPKKT